MAKNKSNTGTKKQTKERAHKRNGIGLFFKSFFLLILLLGMGTFLLFYMKYGRIIIKMQQTAKNYVWSSSTDTFRQGETSLFFDQSGEVISTLSGEKEVFYVQYEDIPANIIDSIVTIEDKRYYEHEGVDYIANVRAAVALIKNEGKVTQGASTITQQLARNIFLSNEVTVERKLTEIFIASEMERKYSKQQILEFYLNNIYFANGYYGIQAAANGYFGKSISELSLSEAAFLCAIPNSPTMYNPITNIQNTYKRRDRILSQMYEDGIITRKDYKKAVVEEVTVKEQALRFHNYVETYVYQCTIEALMEQEGFLFQDTFASEEAKHVYQDSYQDRYSYYQSLLYTGGYRVYTSIDLTKQEMLQETLDRELAGFTGTNEEGIYELQGSAVCIDNETGRVVAIVGGRGQEFNTYTLNRAYQSFRQPGSAIKPLIVYLPYFEGGHNPDEIVNDEKTEDGPKNSNGVYSGEITLRTAIEQSKNTIAWNIFEELTPQVGLSYLKKMNFKKLCSQDEVLAASLGGFTYGTNTLEMAAAYATIEQQGVYRKPTCIVRITDSEGTTLWAKDPVSSVVYDAESCRIMTDTLKGVFTEGTGKGLGISNAITAGKTGTTSDKKDGWFVGYSRFYTTSVWVGYDYPKAMSDLSGSTYPGHIWKKFMQEVHDRLELMEFEPYTDTWTVEEEAETIDEEEATHEEEGLLGGELENPFMEEETGDDINGQDSQGSDASSSGNHDDSDGEENEEDNSENQDATEEDEEELEEPEDDQEGEYEENEDIYYSNGQVYYQDVEE